MTALLVYAVVGLLFGALSLVLGGRPRGPSDYVSLAIIAVLWPLALLIALADGALYFLERRAR